MKALNIALKDFGVSIRTKRFHIIVAFFTLLSLGMIYYLKRLGITQEFHKTPFQMLFLTSFSNSFNYSISLLGILLGVNAINSEIEKGSMKLLASKPTYRDEIIRGKILGGTITLSLALILFYVLTVAFSLILGIPITKHDLAVFLATLPFSLVYGLVFLSLGLLISIFIKKTKNALVLGIFLCVFFSFLLSIIAGIVAFAVAGLPPLPNPPENATNLTQQQLQEILLEDPSYQEWLTDMITTTQKVLYISPNYHYQEIIRLIFGGKPQISEVISALTFKQNFVEERSVLESLSLAWQNIVSLVVMFILPLILTHVKFMKADLR